jgi:hypothetical protein
LRGLVGFLGFGGHFALMLFQRCARAEFCATKACDSSAMANGDTNKEDKTKALAIPILLDIFKTFLLGKCYLVRAKIRILSAEKQT